MADKDRVFLVVVDESPEMRNALRYACRRAKRTGGRVALLYVMPPPEGQPGAAVVELMRRGSSPGSRAGGRPPRRCRRDMTGQPPAIHIREGKSRDELIKLLARGPLDLACWCSERPRAARDRGRWSPPSPARSASQLRIPLTIVPGALSEAEIDAIS